MSTINASLPIANAAVATSPEHPLDPRKLEFGRVFAPDQFVMEYRDGHWGNARIEPLGTFSMHPAAVALHYAQEIFEGLKAFRQPDGSVRLFRPEMNARRMNSSAARMAMPEIDEELFVRACAELSAAERNYIPEYPGCLYLRPVMFATEPCIGVRAAQEFLFFVLALPSGSYFKEVPTGLGAVDVLVSHSVARAAEGGTGAVKTGGNYAVTLKITMEAKRLGCAQVLFLDASEKRRIEEMGGMNILFVRNGALVTPALTGTILPGVTRDSILALAKDLGIPASEDTLFIDEILRGIEDGSVTEAIACGTAAVLTAIRSFKTEDGRTIHLPEAPGRVTQAVYQKLVDIQYGRAADTHGWLTAC
jgi:branched-chain amino acid aminotransferase